LIEAAAMVPKAGWTRQPSDEAKLTAYRKSAAYVSTCCHEVKPGTREITAFFGLLQVPREPSVLVEASILPGF
jgi:hypothetical protein